MLTAQELQAKRQEHQMTQAQLAQAVGIEASLLARYEQGELPISAEHEARLQTAWRRAATPKVDLKAAPASNKPRPAKSSAPSTSATHSAPPAPSARKPAPGKTPSMSQWLQSVAHDVSDHHPAASASAEPASAAASEKVVQAAAQITNDKQRRAALNNLLTAAQSQLEKLFTEDKQVRAMAEAIEQLEPTYRHVVLGLVNQFEQLDPAGRSKGRSGPDQIVQTLKDPSAYVTVRNYLEAALQLLKQAEIGDRPPLMNRLESLSEFDLNTVQLVTKRYQASARSHTTDRPSDAEETPGKTES